MDNLTIDEIKNAASGQIINGDENTVVSCVAIDSRKVKEGCLFVCLQGNRVDGHNYINEAHLAGANLAIVEKDVLPSEIPTIRVASSLRALQSVASYYRQKFQIPVVAISGSVGKTTTKELCSAVLSSKYKTLKSEGNLNSDIGMPLSVFGLDKTYEAAVFEMGMSNFGEIELMSQIAKPYIAVITNIGVSHIEKLGTRENILKAKLEIQQGLAADGILVLNGDDKMLWNLKGKTFHNTVFFGVDNKSCEYKAENIFSGNNYTGFDIVSPFGTFPVRINALGLHNVYNSLAAACVGFSLGLSILEITDGLLFFKNATMRQTIKELGDITLIDDCYNASPDSMKAAIEVLSNMKKTTKIAVLSDMLELGELSDELHKKVGRYLSTKADYLLCYGNIAKQYIIGAVENGMKEENCLYFANSSQCAKELKKIAKNDCAILFKGSRGMRVEDCLNEFIVL